jgi:hypothetical protein
MANPADTGADQGLPPGADPIAANADSVTPIAPPLSSVPTTRAVLRAGWVTGFTAGVLCLIMRGLATLFGTDFVTQPPGFSEPRPMRWIVTLGLPIVVGMLAAGMGGLLLGVRGNKRLVFWIGTAAMAASLSLPLVQPDSVAWGTRIWLAVMLVITWIVVIPQVARVVGDSDPRVTAGYREDIA